MFERFPASEEPFLVLDHTQTCVGEAAQVSEAELGTQLEALTAALTTRREGPRHGDLWPHLRASIEGAPAPESIDSLCQPAVSMRL